MKIQGTQTTIFLTSWLDRKYMEMCKDSRGGKILDPRLCGQLILTKASKMFKGKN